MVTVKLFRQLLIVTISFSLNSCINKIEYHFDIFNETKYELNAVYFDWCNGSKEVSIPKNSELLGISLKYKRSAANLFGSGELCVNVRFYSDSSGMHENLSGFSIPRDQLSRKKNNKIVIREDNSTPGEVFFIDLID